MSVMVKENPLPNEINVGGEAVALNCVKPVKEKKLRKKWRDGKDHPWK